MENKYKAGDYVWSTKEQRAVLVTKFFEDGSLFTCSESAANRYSHIYPRFASGNEILDTLDTMDRINEKLGKIWGIIKDEMDNEGNLDNFD